MGRNPDSTQYVAVYSTDGLDNLNIRVYVIKQAQKKRNILPDHTINIYSAGNIVRLVIFNMIIIVLM